MHLLRENSFCTEDDGKISALCILKIVTKPVQNHGKIGVKFYAERSDAKSVNFALKNLAVKFRRQKPVQSSPKECKKTKSRRKILAMKFRLQISSGKIALDGAGFELAANFLG